MTTIERLEELSGLPASGWHGHCAIIADALTKDIPGSEDVYGHWLGDVAKKGYWARYASRPFIQHAWVVLSDGSIMDPTRFSFENAEPYIWQGENDGNYDRGGEKWRETVMMSKDFPEFTSPCIAYTFALSPECMDHLTTLVPGRFEIQNSGIPKVHFSSKQVHWFANCPLHWLEPHAREIYEAIKEAGLYEFIPIDNRTQVGTL